MDRATLQEVLDAVEREMGHIPYAVAGRAALCMWGCRFHAPTHVSILCAAHSRDVVQCWARTAPCIEPLGERPDRVGVRMPDGRLRVVRIRYVDAELWDVLERVRMRPADEQDDGPGYNGALGRNMDTCRASVLSLPALLDQVARAWTTNPRARRNAVARRELARDMTWILRRIEDGGFVEEGAMPLTAEAMPHVVDPQFWEEFMAENEGAVELFARAGLDLAAVETNNCDDGASMWTTDSTKGGVGSDIGTANRPPT